VREPKTRADIGGKRILLVLLPFWAPQIPPMGLSCLKAFLKQYGYEVKTADLNTEEQLNRIHSGYFALLKEQVPENKKGNLYNVGHDVLRNHMMAHLYYQDESRYISLVKMLINRNFFVHVEDNAVLELNKKIAAFYELLGKYFLQQLEEANPDVLGFSVFDGTLPASLFAAQLTRKKRPKIEIIFGGGIFAEQLAIGSPNWQRFLEMTASYIDKIIVGEGENLLLKFLQDELPPGQRIYTLADIDNNLLDLSSAPIPDFSDYPLNSYSIMAAYVSRSCPFQCSFCSETVQWGKYRKKKPEQIVTELKTLSGTYGKQLFLMCDSLLNPVVTELSERLLEARLSLYWDGYLRADKPVCNRENTLLWRQGGFYRARLGVESGSRKVLDMMRKGITPEQIKDAVCSLADAGIKTTTYWVIGYPGETDADFLMTLELLEALKDNIYEAWASPFFYYYSGQVNAPQWLVKNKPVFPEEAMDMLMLQTWDVEGEPEREEVYSRVSRFVQHCHKLRIPHPYSLHDIYKADERWKKLHKNAVPALVEFRNDGVNIDENIRLKKLNFAVQKKMPTISFDL
jgi:hypothetical protein